MRKWIAFSIVLAVVGVLLATFLLNGGDVRGGDHTDLKPPKITKGSIRAKRAWHFVGETLLFDEQGAYSQFAVMMKRKHAGTPWDNAAAAALVSSNQAAIDAAIAADALGDLRLPKVNSLSGDKKFAFAFNVVSYFLWNCFNKRADDGDHQGAMEIALLSIRFADRVVIAANSVKMWAAGIGCQQNAYYMIDRLANQASKDELEVLFNALADRADPYLICQRAVKAEFEMVETIIKSDGLPEFNIPMPPRSRFQPNRTRNELAELTREMVKQLAVPAKERTPTPERAEPLESDRNAFGEALLNLPMISQEDIGRDNDNVIAHRRLLRAKLALLRFKAAEGSMPESLALLVPGYLDSVPVDPYSGEPVRYDAKRGAVWVVGPDFEDDGGAKAPNQKFHEYPDPTLFVDAPLITSTTSN